MSITFKDHSWYNGEEKIAAGTTQVTVDGTTYLLVDHANQSYQSIQAAVEGAPAGAMILVESGTYTETVVVTKDVTIQSLDGAAATTVIEGGIHVMADGVTIDGFTIESGSTFAGAGPAAILVQANGVTLQNNVLNGSATSIEDAARGVEVTAGAGQDLTISNNTMKGWATGIYANNGVSGTVSGNTFIENNVGMSADGPSALKIEGNMFTDNVTEQLAFGVTDDAFDVTDYLTAANTFTGDAPKVSVWDVSGKDQTLTGSNAAEAIHGGAGIDTAEYAAGAEIAYDAVKKVWTVKVGDVVDTLEGVERVTIGEETYVLAGGGAHGTIANAIADAVDGQTILVAPGTYAETVVVTKNVTIKSLDAAAATTVIEGGIQILKDGVTLDGLSIKGGGAFVAEPAAGVLVQAANVTIANSTLIGPNGAESPRGIVTDASAKGLILSNNDVSGWATGAYLNPGTTGTVEGNTFDGNNVGVSMDDPNGLSVTGNTFNGNTLEQIGVGVPGDALDLSEIVAGNTFDNIPAGKQQVFVYGDGGSEIIIGTDAADAIMGGAGIDTVEYAAGAEIAYDAAKKVWTVKVGDVVDTLDGIERITIGDETYVLAGGGAHGSLNAAIADAVDGQTILVASGTYTGPIVVDKDVTIKGVNVDETETVLDGGIHVTADGVTIDGFTIENGSTFFGSGPAGILVQANGVTLQNNVLHGSATSIQDGARGVLVATGSGQDLTVSNNTMEGWATGIYADAGTTGTVSGNVLTGNKVGMSADAPGAIAIEGNEFDGNTFEQLAFGATSETFNVTDYLAGSNSLTGAAPEISVYGLNNDGQSITGSEYDEAIYGGAGDDVLVGGGGKDAIDGGDGIDTAGYPADAVLAQNAQGHWTVTVGDVVEVLTNVEKVKIGNQTYILVDKDATDGFTSIQAAVDAAAASDIIMVAAGEYTGPVVVYKDVTIKSLAGAAADTIITGGVHIQAAGATLDGLHIKGAGTILNEKAGIYVDVADVTIVNSILTGSGEAGTRGVLVGGSAKNLTIADNQVTGWTNGAYLNPGAAGTVEGNTFKNNTVGLSTDNPTDLSITGNTFDGNTLEQIGVGATGEELDLSQIVTDNTFVGPAGQVVVWGANGNQTITGSEAADVIKGGAGVDTAVYGAGAEIAYDADKGWTVKVGTVVDTFEGVERVTIGEETYVLAGGGAHGSLNAAIADAVDGQTILVASGTYTGPVVVDKGVTIKGAYAGVGGYGRLNSGSETVITGGVHVKAAGVTIDGLHIKGAGTILGEKAGIYVDVADVTIVNSVLTDGAGARGILAGGSAQNLTIADNYMAGWLNGAYLNPGAAGTVTGNVFTGNIVGLAMDDPAGLTISSNVLFGNTLENIGLGTHADATDVSATIGANTILSTAPGGDVSIYGYGSGQAFQGTVYADTFNGTNGDDIFVGGAGNDVINGGAGDDTAVFSGKRTDYAVSVTQDGKVAIADLRGNGGADIVSGVESIQFANGKIGLDTLIANKAPTSVSLDGDCLVAENATNGTVIGKLSAADANQDDILVYELVDNAGGRFAISNGNLVVADGSLLDHEAAESHQVKVKVTDFSGASFEQVLTINVTDVNEAPTAVALSAKSVAENAAGAEIGTLSTTDADAGDSFEYIVSDDRFEVVDGKLTLKAGVSLNFEGEPKVDLTVTSTDKGGLSKQQAFTINVEDVNEAPTAVTFEGAVAAVAENGAAMKVADIRVTDDALGTETLSVVGTDAAQFELRGSELWFKGGANFEAKSSYSVAVKATDKAGVGSATSETFTLKISDVNEAPTDIVVSGGSVLENSANGTVVASLSGVDQDAGEAFSYSLLDNAGGRFAISSDKILVADAFKLDYEQATSHQVVVRVTDRSGASYDETLTLSVADVQTESVAGSSGSDQIVGGVGNDRISGGEGNDVLSAGAGKDVLNGGTGNDRLVGGAGQDTLTGGSGKDVFVFGNKDTGTSKKTADYITDFSGRNGDRIDLRGIDADVKKKGDQNFSFIGTSEFTKAGQVRYEKTKNETYVYLNTDSDTSAEAVIKLKGSIDLQKGWFVL